MAHAFKLAVLVPLFAFAIAHAADTAHSVTTTIRFDSGPLTMVLSAHHIDFTSNEAPATQIGGKGVLPRKCVLTGHARISIADDDVVIVADKLEFDTQGGSSLPTSIKGTGACKWIDGEYTISADKFEVANGDASRFAFAGNAVLIRGTGDSRVRLAAEKFTLVDGRFVGEGKVVVDPIEP